MDKVKIKSLRELDALVAEKVMGLRVVRELDTDNYWVECIKNDPVDEVEFGPLYSTDISAAWEVAEKTRLLEDIKDGFYRLEQWENGWRVAEYSNYDSEGNYYEVGDVDFVENPALAICLAALRVKGIEVELEVANG